MNATLFYTGIRLRHRARGVTIVYVLVLFAVLCGIGSLAIDLGHAQAVKTQLHNVADATAHDYIELYNIGGTSYANTNGPASYSNNPVDCPGGTPSVAVTWGYWSNGTFSTTGPGATAVKVSASCTAANSNAVPLLFGSLLGKRSVDITVTAIASSATNPTGSFTIPATSNPYLAGMPNGTTTVFGDTTAANGATQIVSIPVTPGTYLTFTNLTGTSSVLPGTMPYFGPQGSNNYPYGAATHHGENWDGSLNSAGQSENGISDAVMPESALCGLFLSNTEPDLNTAPASIDWTSSANSNNATYTNLLIQQPFMIGSGKTTGGVVKKFLVPPGATRFYMAMWDGVDYNNNGGSISGTVTQYSDVQIVQ